MKHKSPLLAQRAFSRRKEETSARGSLPAAWCPASPLPRTAPGDQSDGDGRQSCAARSHADALLECCSVCSRVPTLETSALDSPSGIALDRAEPQADISKLAIRRPNQKSEIVMSGIKKLNGGGWAADRSAKRLQQFGLRAQQLPPIASARRGIRGSRWSRWPSPRYRIRLLPPALSARLHRLLKQLCE